MAEITDEALRAMIENIIKDMIAKISFRKGKIADLPELDNGEPGWAQGNNPGEYSLYVGSPDGNILIGVLNNVPPDLGDIEVAHNSKGHRVRIQEKDGFEGLEIYARNGDLIMGTDLDEILNNPYYYTYFQTALEQDSTRMDVKILSIWNILLKCINKINFEAPELEFKSTEKPAKIKNNLNIEGHLKIKKYTQLIEPNIDKDYMALWIKSISNDVYLIYKKDDGQQVKIKFN